MEGMSKLQLVFRLGRFPEMERYSLKLRHMNTKTKEQR